MPAKAAANQFPESIDDQAQAALDWLRAHANPSILDEYAPRYGIHARKALGVSMANIKLLAKRLGRDHKLAEALWDSGWYEARLLTSLVDVPARVTSTQMDRWCRGFDNWGVCDTLCFNLFDRTPHAWAKVAQWSTWPDEYGKRAAFALLASLALHDRDAANTPFLTSLSLIERAAGDERNFVKKAVSWALRAIGRRNPLLNASATELALRLTASSSTCTRWIGRDALKDLTAAAVQQKWSAP